MKKKIIAIITGIAIIGVACFQVIPTFADTPNPLDHVIVSPTSTTLPVGGSQQFSARAYDSDNQTLSNVTFFWLVTSGGGTINSDGLFTAGSVPGTYIDTVEVVAIQGTITAVATANITVTGEPGTLHRVSLTPKTVTLVPGDTQKFSAQAYDINNVAITGYAYTWSVVNGGGTINTSGLFTAGATTGKFVDTVQVFADNGTDNGTARATVTIKQNARPVQVPRIKLIETLRIIRLFQCYLNARGFENFLGGQWQVKDGDAVKTIKVVPGIVQATPDPPVTSLTITPNNQTGDITFILTADTVIQPKNATFVAEDSVIVVTVDNEVVLVVKITPVDTVRLPPGLRKQDDDKRFGKSTPPGWAKGIKNGWWQWFGKNKGNKSRDD